VRELERELDQSRQRIRELEDRFASLDRSGDDRGAARVRAQLDQQRQKLSQTRADLEQAWAARDAMLGKKS